MSRGLVDLRRTAAAVGAETEAEVVACERPVFLQATLYAAGDLNP